jgi:putative hydrolase of the HAD superfamily
MFAGHDDLLRDLRATYRLGILTDGTPAVQKSKCVALGLVGAVDAIVYTWEFGQEREKPHPQGFRMILDRLQVMPGEALFIGDSPEKDCIGARNVGMKCIRVQRPPLTCATTDSDEADFVIESLLQLPLLLRQLEGSK